MKSIIEQKVATKNQITTNKPDIIKNANVLQGYLANSINGGHIKPIAFAPIMAGTRVMEHRMRFNLKMLTPKTPAYQKLKGRLSTYFVPNSRVWENWEKFSALKGGATTTRPKEIPNIGGKEIPFMEVSNAEDIESVVLTDTEIWRNSWISTYLPRFQTGAINQGIFRTFPKYNILPLRGFKAIYNDFERNKEYDMKFNEFKGDLMTETEYEDTLLSMLSPLNSYKFDIRGKRQNSYYTDYRTELLGTNEEYELVETPEMLSSLVEYQKLVSQARASANNAQLNDWDIISKEHGSKKLTQGKVQLLGTQEFGINYKSVTQSAYNINEQIQKEFQVLGEQGAYSYTEIDLPLYQMTEFIEDGFIHVILQISADTVFETAFDRTLLNVGEYDIYRPELKEMIDDVLYDIEKCGTRITNEQDLTKICGYKRKFSEYFKLPNSITGDLSTRGYYSVQRDETALGYQVESNNGKPTLMESKGTFQFFEVDDKETTSYQNKNIWQDYTDLMINKNLAIKQEEMFISEDITNNMQPYITIKGDNQFVLLGIQTITADMPIDENIKNNYTVWGEE